MFFIDRNVGWITGGHGTILHTRSGGHEWIRQESGFEGKEGQVTSDIGFLTSKRAYAVGYCTPDARCDRVDILLRTFDGAETRRVMVPSVRLKRSNPGVGA